MLLVRYVFLLKAFKEEQCTSEEHLKNALDVLHMLSNLDLEVLKAFKTFSKQKGEFSNLPKLFKMFALVFSRKSVAFIFRIFEDYQALINHWHYEVNLKLQVLKAVWSPQISGNAQQGFWLFYFEMFLKPLEMRLSRSSEGTRDSNRFLRFFNHTAERTWGFFLESITHKQTRVRIRTQCLQLFRVTSKVILSNWTLVFSEKKKE